jgi:8-oxo-dGTP pyrophosphatase MutT (NUDIX family)
MVNFKNLAIAMLPLFEDGTTILIGQHRFALGQYSWEIPEGGGPMNEDPLITAKRELSEEANLQAESWWPLFDNVHLSNSSTDERSFAFLAWGLSPCDAHKLDDVEDLKVCRVPVGQAVQMVVNGEISDGLALAVLLKADHLWRTKRLPEAAMRAFDNGQI